MSTPIGPESLHPDQVDDAIGAYIRWREACAHVREAYDNWTGAAKTDRMLASCAYIAALDREETAAGVYAEAMTRLEIMCANAGLVVARDSPQATR